MLFAAESRIIEAGFSKDAKEIRLIPMHITNAQNDIESILFSEAQLRSRVAELGAQLTAEYADKHPIVVCILKGASFFYTDLCRMMQCHISMDFIAVSSYGAGSQSSGVVRILKDLDTSITGRHVIIVEDIIDSGLTLKHLRELLSARKPASIKTVCLLDKHERHDPHIAADLCGFRIPDAFVVGYGLDYAGYYRNLPYIGVLKRAAYA